MKKLSDLANEAENHKSITIKRFRKVLVKNIDHEPDENSTLLADWETVKGHEAYRCSNLNCPNEKDDPALVGAHVCKVGNDTDDNWYITPMCHKCNSSHNKEAMTVYEHNLVRLSDIRKK